MGIQEYDAASNEVGMEIDEDDEDDDEGPILVDEIVENELDESNGVFNDEVIFDREIRKLSQIAQQINTRSKWV